MIRVPGQREGTWRYLYNGHIFHKDPYSGTRYICGSASTRYRCGASTTIDDNEEVKFHGYHNHRPSTLTIKEPVIKELKRRAMDFTQLTSDIIHSVFEQFPYIIGIMKQSAAQEIINSERRKHRPPIPTEFRDLGTMLANWPMANSIYQGQFTAEDRSTGVVFYNEDLFRRMIVDHEIHIDGTFKSVPSAPKAMQLLIIHFRRNDIGIPVVFILCERRTSSFYQAMWRFLIQQAPSLAQNLQVINCDYERAIISSIRSIFGNRIRIRGCWFHFIRAVTRMWKKLRLPRNEASNDILYKVWAIPLLPAYRFAEAITIITLYAVQHSELNQRKITKFIDYIKNFFVRNAMIISVYGSSIRTNNISEACHRHLVRKLGGIHPPLQRFIPYLKNYIDKVKLNSRQIDEGLMDNIQRQNRQQQIDLRIEQLQLSLRLGRTSIMDFLILAIPRPYREDIDVNLEIRESDSENEIENDDSDDDIDNNLPQDEELLSPEERAELEELAAQLEQRERTRDQEQQQQNGINNPQQLNFVRNQREGQRNPLITRRRRGRPSRAEGSLLQHNINPANANNNNENIQNPEPVRRPRGRPRRAEGPLPQNNINGANANNNNQNIQNPVPPRRPRGRPRRTATPELVEDDNAPNPPVPGIPFCIICIENEANVIYIPCGHFCICANCIREHGQQLGAQCPMCRTPFEATCRVYI